MPSMHRHRHGSNRDASDATLSHEAPDGFRNIATGSRGGAEVSGRYAEHMTTTRIVTRR